MLNVILTQAHRWVGVPLGVLFLVTFVTGLLVGGVDLLRAIDRKGQTYRSTSTAEDARALERMTQDVPGLFQAVMPTPRTPFYQARARGETRTYRIGDLALVDHEVSSGRGFYRLALGLHRTFLLGRQAGPLGISGADAVAWVTLGALALSLLGIWLWWPYRHSFRFTRTVPLGWTRSEMLRSHMTGGVVTLVVVVLLCVTGVAITYRDGARAVLGASRISDTGLRESPYYVVRDWETWLALARQEMDGELAAVSFPRGHGGGRGDPADLRYGVVDPAAAVQFRFATGSDWFGTAGSRVYVDPLQSALIGSVRFGDLPLGQRFYNLIVPLHAGRGAAPAYLAALLLCTGLATIMTFSGVVSFVLKHVKRRALPEGGGRRKREMRNALIAATAGVVLGGLAGYFLPGGGGSGSARVDGTPPQAQAQVQAEQGRGRSGMRPPGGRVGPATLGGQGGHGQGGRGGGHGPGGHGRHGAGRPAAAPGGLLADPERSLARLSVALTLTEAQQQGVREVMREHDERLRAAILAVLDPQQARRLAEIETGTARE